MKSSGPVMKRSGPVMKSSGPVMKRSGPVMKCSGPVMKRSGPVMRRTGPEMKRSGPVMKRTGPVMRRTGPVMRRTGPVMKRTGPMTGRRGAGPQAATEQQTVQGGRVVLTSHIPGGLQSLLGYLCGLNLQCRRPVEDVRGGAPGVPTSSVFHTAPCLTRSIRRFLLQFNPTLVEGRFDLAESYNISVTSQKGGFV
ncbi:unnamed protein product [Gadus morhua 'NCC']